MSHLAGGGTQLAQFRMAQQDAPLITTQCITLNSDWRSKEEVLKGMTDNLLLAGRCHTRVSWRPISGRAKRIFHRAGLQLCYPAQQVGAY